MIEDQVIASAIDNAVVADLVHLSIDEKKALLSALERKRSDHSITSPWTERHRLLWAALNEEVGPKQDYFIPEKDKSIWKR